MSLRIEWREDRQRWQVLGYYVDGKRKRPLFREKSKAEKFVRTINLGLEPEDAESITIAEASRKCFERESKKKDPKSRTNDKLYLNLHHYFMTEVVGLEFLKSVQLEDLESFRDWLSTRTEQPWPESANLIARVDAKLETVTDQQKRDALLKKRAHIESSKKFEYHRPMRWNAATVNRCLRVIKRFYKRHCQWKDLKENPSMYLEFLDSIEKVMPAMSVEQYLLAIKECSGWLKRCMAFTFLTGAPPTCISRLDWEDVNLAGRTYELLRKKGAKANWRKIPMTMSEQTFELLSSIRNGSDFSCGPVFRDERGLRLLPDRISREANEAIRRAGIDGVTFYGLRHALASDLTTAGIATEIVRQAMGHQSISTTQKYANKVKLEIVSNSLESVRGGKLVANQ